MMSVTLGEDLCKLLCVHINRSGLTRKRKGEREKGLQLQYVRVGYGGKSAIGCLKCSIFFLLLFTGEQ